MTPFDRWALLAMLLAFYPTPSPAALQRARDERPEYFAGGSIIGSKGDKLQLPDGRVFDVIFAAGGLPGQQRWQVLDVTNEPPGPDDPFELEPGPLVPLDAAMTIFPARSDPFADLVAGALVPFDGAADVLAGAARAIVEADGGAALDRAYDATIGPALEAHVGTRKALELDDLADVIDATNSHDADIDAGTHDYDEPAARDIAEPDPGEPPGDEKPPEGEKPPI